MEGTYCSLFLNLFTAHLIGDFLLQTDKTCRSKQEKGCKSLHLYIHALIIFLCTWLAFGRINFVLIASIVGLTHLVIDFVKSKLHPSLKVFVLDQMLHILILLAVTWVSVRFMGWTPYLGWTTFCKYIPLAISFIVCAKPANILIKNILQAYSLGNIKEQTCEAPFKAGGLIGTLERWLILVFFMLEQYEAIGFLLAAKSIVRFKDTETDKTEYVLAGTLLSVSIAVACGILLR